MQTFIVIPEGLATDQAGQFYVSDFYAAALDLVLLKSVKGDHVYLAPANSFGAEYEEDYYGRDYLNAKGCVATIELIDRSIHRKKYLDTLDNAKYLKQHLILQNNWPLNPVLLVCNRPHRWRAWVMFVINGYKIRKVYLTKPEIRTSHKMVKRLWFYDVPVVQYSYEAVALVYNVIKFIFRIN